MWRSWRTRWSNFSQRHRQSPVRYLAARLVGEYNRAHPPRRSPVTPPDPDSPTRTLATDDLTADHAVSSARAAEGPPAFERTTRTGPTAPPSSGAVPKLPGYVILGELGSGGQG